MKKTLLLAVCLFPLILPAIVAQTMTEWDDVSVTSLNRIQSHDLSIPFADAEAARSLDLSRSPWFLDLNGTWKFRWSALPSKVPSGFYADSYNAASASYTLTVTEAQQTEEYTEISFYSGSQEWGYRTYVTQTAVDFSRSVGVKGYYATGLSTDGTEVEFTEVIGVVPASTPLLLVKQVGASEKKLRCRH